MTTNQKNIDFELIEKVKRNDTLAFQQLVDRHKDVSLSLAGSIVKDQAKAEDVLQEVFIKVYKKLDSFQFKATFSTWLYSIVVNTAYNHLKKGKVHLEIDKTHYHSFETTEKTGFENLKEAEQKKYVLKALNKLKPDEALVLRLFYLYDFSIQEVAEITRFSTSKIKVDLHRGRKNMEHVLKKLLGTELNSLL